MTARRSTYFLGGAAVLVVGAVAAGRRLLLSVTVHESSMEPGLRSGDHVLVRRARGEAVRAGQVVVVRRADAPESLIIKRVVALPGDDVPPAVLPAVPGRHVPEGRMVLLGDNPEHSTDSRLLGFYRLSDVVGVVTPAR